MGVISQQEHKCIQQQIDIEQLKLDFKVIESERKKLEYEYELQSSILQECKLKICELSGAEAKMLFPKQQSRQIYTAEFSHLRKKV